MAETPTEPCFLLSERREAKGATDSIPTFESEELDSVFPPWGRQKALHSMSDFVGDVIVVDGRADDIAFIRKICAMAEIPQTPQLISNAEAVAFLRKTVEKTLVVFLILDRPKTDGIALLTQLRRSSSLDGLCVVMLADEESDEVVTSCQHGGANGLLIRNTRTPKATAILRGVLAARPRTGTRVEHI